MVILREQFGSNRVELQQLPIILPTDTWDTLTPGEKQRLDNAALQYAILHWDGNILVSIISSAAWKGALEQYQVRVQQIFGETVPDLDLGKNTIINGQIVDAEGPALAYDPIYGRSTKLAASRRGK